MKHLLLPSLLLIAGCGLFHDRDGGGPASPFSWEETSGSKLDLLYNGRKVMRYVFARDSSTPERRLETYKPFHHVFDASGEKLLTKGPGGFYSHHRGIFIGWNRVGHHGRVDDFWHMKGVVQEHGEMLILETGPCSARMKARINWKDGAGRVVIVEEREVVAVPRPKPPASRRPDPAVAFLLFHFKLTAPDGDVVLDGDPEHGGFQYRAHNDLAGSGARAVYRFHENGIDPRRDRDLPYAAMSYNLHGKRYTVQHMNHPLNPKPVIYSAYRGYGRFGVFFTAEIKEAEPLHIWYGISVSEGGFRADMKSRYEAFLEIASDLSEEIDH